MVLYSSRHHVGYVREWSNKSIWSCSLVWSSATDYTVVWL